MEQSSAAKALDAWCEGERGRAAGVAKACGVTPTTVYNWRRGAITPRAENCIAIERHTDGAVRSVEWEGVPIPSDLDVAPSPTLPPSDVARVA